MPSPSSQSVPADIIIVVGRQFGSGGRRIGKMLAERFKLNYYDKELLSEAADRLGFSPDIFARYDEKRPSALRSLLSNAFGVQDAYLQNPMSSESIFAAQGRVIAELAERGGCVFVGRSADYVLRHHPRMVSIFLHAPVERRAEAIMRRGDVDSLPKGEEMARKFDRKREEYYNYFTGRNWGRSDNYHLSVDTSQLGDEQIVDLIATMIGMRFANAAAEA